MECGGVLIKQEKRVEKSTLFPVMGIVLKVIMSMTEKKVFAGDLYLSAIFYIYFRNYLEKSIDMRKGK
jgi:hypothetical protein